MALGVCEVPFVNYNNDYGPSYLFGARDAANRLTNGRVSGVTYDDSFLLYDRRKPVDENLRPSQWGAVVHDLDGSFGLAPDTALVADHPMMVDDTCVPAPGTGQLCNNRYGWVRIDFRKGYEFDQSLFSVGRLNVLLDYLHDGDTVILEFRSMPATARVRDVDYKEAQNLADLRQGLGKRFVRVGDSLFVKMQAKGTTWTASDYISIVW